MRPRLAFAVATVLVTSCSLGATRPEATPGAAGAELKSVLEEIHGAACDDLEKGVAQGPASSYGCPF
jgi:hypothetical protein